jgi:ABC-type antimicrobial peptide transport system permease subunit
VVAGLGIGVVIALSVSQVLGSLLFEVSPPDPATIAAMGVVLIAVALVACYFPTRRAARVDPVIALRSE